MPRHSGRLDEAMPRTKRAWWSHCDHRSLTTIAAISFAGAYGLMAIGALPLLVTHWASGLALGEQSAGLIAAANVTGATLGLAVCLWLVTRLPLPTIATIGVLVAVLGDLSSLVATGTASLCGTRLISGFGMGLVSASVTNWIARHEDSGSGFGMLMLFQFLMTSALLFIVPQLQTLIGPSAIYLCLLAAGLITLIFIPLMNLNGGATPLLRQTKPRPTAPRLARFSGLAIAAGCAVAGQALFELAGIGIWTYEHRFGVASGLSESRAAELLALATLMGIPASLVVIWVGNRFGRLMPILIGLAGYAIPAICFALREPSPLGYMLGLGAMNAAWCFVIPYFQAAQSALDRSGRTAIAGVLVASLAGSIGPVLLGTAISGTDFAPLFILATIILALSTAAAIPAGIAADRVKDGTDDEQATRADFARRKHDIEFADHGSKAA